MTACSVMNVSVPLARFVTSSLVANERASRIKLRNEEADGLVSITRLRLRSWRYFPFFLIQAMRSSRQAATAEGNIAATLMRDRNLTFWTRTIWTSEAAMKAFMHSGPHGKVMRKLLDWCDEAAVVHWSQETS